MPQLSSDTLRRSTNVPRLGFSRLSDSDLVFPQDWPIHGIVTDYADGCPVACTSGANSHEPVQSSVARGPRISSWSFARMELYRFTRIRPTRTVRIPMPHIVATRTTRIPPVANKPKKSPATTSPMPNLANSLKTYTRRSNAATVRSVTGTASPAQRPAERGCTNHRCPTPRPRQ